MTSSTDADVIARTIRDALGDVRSFFDDLVHEVERLDIDVSTYPVSHLAYRCPSWVDYVTRRDALEAVCSANVESLWGDRPISKLLLAVALPLGVRHELPLVELIPPPHNPNYRLGLEHLGFVLGPGSEAFRRRHRAVLSGQQDQGPFNQPLFITLDDGRLVKFHHRSLREAVELGGDRFDGFHHAVDPRSR